MTAPASIALVNPLGDYGIASYTHELAEGLTACGARADVYAAGTLELGHLARRHRLYPALGSLLLRQRDLLASPPGPAAVLPVGPRQGLVRPGSAGSVKRSPVVRRLRQRVLSRVLPLELAAYLRWRGYDVVWTQWPVMEGSGPRLWQWMSRLGSRIVHTVHDLYPNEPIRGYDEVCRAIYERADLLVVHSRSAAGELLELFPETRGRVLVAPHGLYTMYPMAAAARTDVRARLGVAPDQVLVLCFGGIRPYKNTDAVLDALVREPSGRIVLLVAGREWGYPDLVPGDPLGRTRRLVAQRGLEQRVRLLPGPFDPAATAELLAATDVALLPYLSSSGSGVLLLCMTFGLHVAATAVGGMDEYLADYSRRTRIEAPTPDAILTALVAAAEAVRRAPSARAFRAPWLDWRAIAAYTLRALEEGPPDPLAELSFAERFRAAGL